MKILVTVDEFLENGGILKEGRQIWRERPNSGYSEQYGEYVSMKGRFVVSNYACNLVETDVNKALVQIDVTPIWI